MMGWILLGICAVNGICHIGSGDPTYGVIAAIFFVGATLCWTGESIEQAIERAGRGSK